MKLQKVEQVRVFEHALEQIRASILNGEMPPGAKLPSEQELCTQLDVGRSSIREALRVLEAENLVEVKRGSGVFVTAYFKQSQQTTELARWLEQREETLIQVLQVREFIEGLTAHLAAQQATPLEIAGLKSLNEETSQRVSAMSRHPSDGLDECIDELAKLDSTFHLTISQMSGNDIAHEITSHIVPAFQEANKAVLYLHHRAKSMEREHNQIVLAIEAHNPFEAERNMRRHLEKVIKQVIGE